MFQRYGYDGFIQLHHHCKVSVLLVSQVYSSDKLIETVLPYGAPMWKVSKQRKSIVFGLGQYRTEYHTFTELCVCVCVFVCDPDVFYGCECLSLHEHVA